MFTGLFRRGLERIRTAVDGFADRCLASRPRDHFGGANILISLVNKRYNLFSPSIIMATSETSPLMGGLYFVIFTERY